MSTPLTEQNLWERLCNFVEDPDEVADMSREEINEYLEEEGIDTAPAFKQLQKSMREFNRSQGIPPARWMDDEPQEDEENVPCHNYNEEPLIDEY
jgi:hypothetical protein